jgi:hypothetical protein
LVKLVTLNQDKKIEKNVEISIKNQTHSVVETITEKRQNNYKYL